MRRRCWAPSRIRRFFEITLPLLTPAIAAAALLVFIFDFTSFGVVLILGGAQFATLEVEIYRQTVNLFNLPMAAALSLVQIACTLALTAIYTRLQARDGSPVEFAPAIYHAAQAGHVPRADAGDGQCRLSWRYLVADAAHGIGVAVGGRRLAAFCRIVHQPARLVLLRAAGCGDSQLADRGGHHGRARPSRLGSSRRIFLRREPIGGRRFSIPCSCCR